MDNVRSPEVPHSARTLLLLSASAVVAVSLLFTTVDPWLDKVGILVGGLDAHIYRDGALRILRGQPLYTETTLYGLLYTYTPFSTLVFLPVVAVPWAYVTDTWLVLNLITLLGCVLMCWRILGYRIGPRLVGLSALVATICVFLEPVRTTLYYGQINLILMLLVLWGVSRPEHARLRGLGVGLAAGIKLVPGFFILYFLALRQWRSAVTAAAAFVATVVLAWIVLPDDSRQYWGSTFLRSDRIAPDGHPANQSIRGTLAHLAGGAVPTWLWLLLVTGVVAAALTVTAALDRRGERLLAVTLAGATASAVSPFSWSHHWVWFVPLFVYCVHRAQRDARWWIAAAALWLWAGAWAYHWSDTWVSVGLFLFPPSWPIAPLLMNGYVIAYAVLLVAAATAVRRVRSVSDTTQ
ncbi:glycosyltransferase 87 family protein [Nocardia otitidiscaviarum]|uniref:glycosyltransferase 87 family protein n=1 Tax=Nocardia otitidiscaviarum TaxID=1823 RepID=UPI002B4B576E|nr:glycosyltransferase 87 family protein [Nocardia otitidiscaviarum]